MVVVSGSGCCATNLPLPFSIASTSSPHVWRGSSRQWLRWPRRNSHVVKGSAPRRFAALGEREAMASVSFLHVRSGEELISCIRDAVTAGRLPSNIAYGMEELYHSYRNAVLQSGSPVAEDIILSNMSTLLDRVVLDAEDPFTFPVHHKAIREPFDYYMLGQNYIKPLIDFSRSYIGNIQNFHEMEDKLRKGHNVVLISNHQTEADPAVIALLLETSHPCIAKEMTYVAGDRVIADPLCKPFSMGRNLLCVYSKKHLYDIPELVEAKKKSNAQSLKEMALLLRSGGKIVWIAPSGGRDRPNLATGDCYPALFDSSSVENVRRLANRSGIPVHWYPLALLCYDIMPPPAQVEKQIGEHREVSFHGVGISVGQQLQFDEIVIGLDNSEEIKPSFSQALYASVHQQYSILKSAIYDHQGLDASDSIVSLSQPWA